MLATRDTVFVSSSSPVLKVRNLILGDAEGLSAPILVISTGVISLGKWIIHKNAILTQKTPEPFKIANLFLKTGGQIEHAANSSAKEYIVNLEVANEFIMESGSMINVKGKGYARGKGPGATGYIGGAGYGGHGGNGYHAEGGVPYGSIVNPDELGSGGGPNPYWGPGGSGGGLAVLKISGTLQLDGVIDADGIGGLAESGGGSSGGAINITAGILTGSGTIHADGGNGVSSVGGGGSGGD
ncbi:MAG: hypothetical protein HY746_10400 [Elusimicrobia bacterium]|nr:hypothetical protein [Elusimicrobiota bacterium]